MSSAPARVNPPGPKGIVQPLLNFRRNPPLYLQSLAREYGDIVHFRLGNEHFHLVNNPEWIKDVLVTHQSNFKKSRGLERAKRLLGEGLLTSEGEFHRRQRRLAQPAFHRERIAGYAVDMVKRTVVQRDQWRTGQQIDMDHEMMRLTLAIVAKTLFDAQVDSDADEVGKALTTILELFINSLTLPFGELLEKLPLPSKQRFDRAKAQLDAIIYRFIAERRKDDRDHGDLLSMLLIAQDHEGDGTGMTDEQLRDELMTIFLAGHETTANALTWTWYLLSQHPEVEKKFHAEIDALGGKTPSSEDMPRLRYVEMVMAEAMRLYPPAWSIGRRAIGEYRIGDYVLPPRSIVLTSQYVTHHDPRYFPNPDKFDPERWTPEEREKRHKFTYFPFGGGARLCIGESFAWMEGVLVLAAIAQKWKFRLVPGHPVEPLALLTLRPRYGMQMTVEAR